MIEPVDYSPSSGAAQLLAALVVLPRDERIELSRKFADDDADLSTLLADAIGMANAVAANCREWIETEMIAAGAVHPERAHQLNLPTMLGAAIGASMAAQVRQDGTCNGCAMRLGTVANQCLPTVSDVRYVDGDDTFLCHLEGLDEAGEPARACVGWARWRALGRLRHGGG